MRRPFALVVVGILLASCSSGGQAPEAAQSTSVGQAPPTADPPSDGSIAPVDCRSASVSGSVEVWHAMGGNVAADLWDEWEKQLERETKINLVVRSFGSDIDIVQQLARTERSDWPDIVLSSEKTLRALWDSQGFVSPLECDGTIGNDVLPIASATYQIGGKLAALPFGVSTLVLVADLAEIRKAGLDPDAPPQTLEQLLEWSRRVVSTGASPHGMVLTDHCASLVLSDFAAGRGQLEVVPDNGRSSLDASVQFESADNVVDFSELRQAVAEGHTSYIGPNGSGFDDLAQLSPVDGDATMTIHTSAALGDVISLLEGGNFPGAELGVMPLPAPGDGAQVGGNALYLVRQDDQGQLGLAWAALEWLYQPARLAELAAKTGYVPATSSAAEESSMQAAWTAHPELKVAYDQVVASPATAELAGGIFGPFDERDRVLYDLCGRIITGTGDIGAELRSAASTINDLLATYASVSAGGAVGSSPPSSVAPEDSSSLVSGSVECVSGAAVVGVWVEAVGGGSGFATRSETDASKVDFEYELTSQAPYEIHVGCGGGENAWAGSYFSGTVTGSGHSFVCDDTVRSDHGVCAER